MNTLQQLREDAQSIKLLYVEDEPALRESVARYLNKLFTHIDVAENGEQGLELYKHNKYDIVITDIEMPKLNGIEMSKVIKSINSEQDIIITSAYTNPEYFVDAIRVGISGYIIKPIDFKQVNNILKTTISKIKHFRENENYKKNLEKMVLDKTREYKKLQDEKVKNYKQTIYSIVSMIEGRDSYTGNHSQRVANYSILIAKAMGYSDSESQRLYQAAMLHDLGKIVTPDSILLKPGRLNSLEYKLIQEHVTESYELLKKIPMFSDLAEIVLEHHERCDGTGYPHGKKGNEILPLSRIMIVADAFDAMTTNRIYKGRKSLEKALDEIKNLSGKQFHPEVIDVAVKVFQNIELQQNTSQLPQTELEKERFSYYFKDVISSTYNRNYLDIILTRNSFNKEYCCIHIIYLHNFSAYNNRYGWNEGDILLNEFASILKESNPDSLIFRVHGDDFILLNKQHLELNPESISSLELLKNADITVSFGHHNLNNESIEDMNSMDRYLLSPIAELQQED